MTNPVELAEKLIKVSDKLSGDWDTLTRQLAHCDSVAARLPADLAGLLTLPHHRIASATDAINKLQTGLPTMLTSCVASENLSVLAAAWREVAAGPAPIVTEHLDAIKMAKGQRGWVSPASGEYDHFVDKFNDVATGLETLLRSAATAMDNANDDLTNWWNGMLGYVLGALVAALELVGAAIAFWSAFTTWLDAFVTWYFAASVLDAVVADAALVTAADAMLPVVIGVAVAVLGAVAAYTAIDWYLKGVVTGAAGKIMDAEQPVKDSPRWPVPNDVPISGWAR